MCPEKKVYPMKKIALALGTCMALWACNAPGDVSQENLAVIDNYITAVEQMDFDAMDSYLADDYMGIGPSYGDSINKAGAVASWRKNVQELYQKIEYKRSRNVATKVAEGENQGDWVSNWAELEITFRDDRGTVTIWANTVYQLVDGKIAKSYTFYNEADALRQLGYVFINPQDL